MERLHASCVVLAERGVLITGPSGAGKTTLALDCVDWMLSSGRFAALVADDQVECRTEGGRLLAEAPAILAGLAEIRGHGIVQRPVARACVVDLLVELVPPHEAERMPPSRHVLIQHVPVRAISLAARCAPSRAALLARLFEASISDS